jgi:hypothetical protein
MVVANCQATEFRIPDNTNYQFIRHIGYFTRNKGKEKRMMNLNTGKCLAHLEISTQQRNKLLPWKNKSHHLGRIL